MKSRILHLLPTVFWLGCAASLIAGIGLESDWGNNWRKPMVRKKFGPSVNGEFDSVPPFKLAAMEAILPETVDRPLLVPTRRPPPPPVAPVAAAPSMVRGQFTLKGTMVNTEVTTAYLFETATGKSFGVKKGDTIPGKNIIVAEVANNSAVLKQGDDTESLELPRSSASPRNPFPQSSMQPQPGVAGMNSNGVPFPQPGMQPGMQPPGAGPTPPFPTGQPGAAAVAQNPGVAPPQPSADQFPGRRRFQNVTPPPQ